MPRPPGRSGGAIAVSGCNRCGPRPSAPQNARFARCGASERGAQIPARLVHGLRPWPPSAIGCSTITPASTGCSASCSISSPRETGARCGRRGCSSRTASSRTWRPRSATCCRCSRRSTCARRSRCRAIMSRCGECWPSSRSPSTSTWCRPISRARHRHPAGARPARGGPALPLGQPPHPRDPAGGRKYVRGAAVTRSAARAMFSPPLTTCLPHGCA